MKCNIGFGGNRYYICLIEMVFANFAITNSLFRMIRKFKHLTLLALCLLLGLITMQSCERINEHKENGLQLATDFCSMQSELASIVEVADEIGDKTTAKGISSKLFLGAFGKSTSLTISDSTYFDGDGIEFEIDFGPVTLPLSENQRGYDGKYRAGKMHINIQTHYQENSSKLDIEINESDHFMLGSNAAQPRNISFNCAFRRQDSKTQNLTIESFTILGPNTITLDGTVKLFKLNNSNPGVIGNKYQMTGQGTLNESNHTEHNWEIIEPLIKNVVPGCSGEYVNGILSLRDLDKSATISLDYDPFENESCDKIVRVTIAGKTTDITLN
jgi:hypothetical protein